MKELKIYQLPSLEIVRYTSEDVVRTSVEVAFPEEWGWGEEEIQ